MSSETCDSALLARRAWPSGMDGSSQQGSRFVIGDTNRDEQRSSLTDA